MGSRKNILKNLGIPEYPWSSDDDEPPIDSTPEPRPAANPQLRPSAEQTTPSSPGTSGRELFLSLLSLPSNGNRSGTAPPGSSSHRYFRSENVPLAYLSRSPHTPAPELRERPGGRDDSHIQRVLAFKRLTRNMGMGSNSGIGRYTRCQIPRGRGSTRPGSVVPSEINGSSCMRMAHWRTVRRPYTSNRTGTAHQFMDQSGTSAAHRHRTHSMEVNNSDDEQDDPVVSRSRPTGSMSALTSTPEPPIELETEVDAHASAIDTSGVSPEEDIVEILDEPVAVDLDMVVPHFMAKGRSPAIPAIPTSTDSNLPSTSREDEVDAPQAEIQSQGVKRKRCTSSDDKASDSFTVKEFNQSLLRLLECPVCLEWMEPPMSQCRRGHLVCNRCRARLASCPVCRTTFSSVRNRAMEGFLHQQGDSKTSETFVFHFDVVAEMLRYPCRHGCGREVRLRRRTPHEASCNSRHYMCPAPLCTHKLPLPHSLLAAHFNSKHLNLLKLGCRHRFGIKVNSESHDTWLLIALEQYFQVRVDVDVRTWGVIVYVAYIGPKCNAKDYAYEVSIEGQHNGRRLNYRRSTHSDLESSSLNVSRQDCFHLTLDQALNFIRFKNRHCDAEKFLEFDVEISKIDPPPSRDDSDS